MKGTSPLMLGLLACGAAVALAAQPVDPGPPPGSTDPSATHTTPDAAGGSGSYITAPNSRTNTSDNSRLAALLPEGVSSEAACRGINSLSLCAATLHAAQNLNISFTDLKRKVEAGDRLSAAIHTLKPNVDADAEERRAQDQALSDLQSPRG
jgi:hypothetical protein